jgi:outer membrane protein TolC
MRHPIFFIIFLLRIFSANGQINIDTCQRKAQLNYPLIKQYDLIAQSAEYTISNANKAYLPQISLTGIGGYIINGFPSVSLPGQAAKEPEKFQLIGIGQLNQTIWDGGATSSQKDITRANAEFEKANVDVSFYSLRERINQLYFGILVIDEQLKQLKILNDNLQRNLEKAKLTKENGYAYQSDVDEVKAEVLNIAQKKIEFDYTRKGYVEMLSFLIGEKLDENVQLITPVVVESPDAFAGNRPELRMFATQIKLIEAQSSLNKVSNMPKIGLLGAGVWITPGASFGTSSLTDLAIVGLSLSWNTGGLYRNSNNKNLDRIKIERITSQQETFSFNNNLQLTQIKSEIEKQKAILQQDEEIVKLKGNIKKSYQLRYDNGVSPMNDLINALNKENESLSNRALHNIELLMSIYNYKTTSGN